MVILFSVFICCCFFISSSLPTQATILISEVAPNPTSGPEWVELYNTASQSASLANWSLQDQLSSPSTIYTFSAEAMIAASEYLLVELPTSKLNNSADGVTLLNQENSIQDQMQYESSETGKSWSRKNWDSNIFLQTTPTPNNQNLLPTAAPTPTSTITPTTTPQPSTSIITTPIELELISLYPCPEKSELEWVEIINLSETTADLTNWKFKDEQNNSVALSGTIPAQQSKQIILGRSILNNAGDSAFLENPSATIVSSLSYRGCNTGEIITANTTTEEQTDAATNSAILALEKTELLNQETTSGPSVLSKLANPVPINLANLRLVDPTPTPTPRATYIDIPPLPPKNAVLSVILGGMLISGSGITLLPKERFKKIFAI